MTDRPILFSAPMVRALVTGTKTQTRLLAKDVPDQPEARCHPSNRQRHPAPYLDSYCSQPKTAANPRGMSREWCWWQVDDRPGLGFKVAHQPGDRLWVRETWAVGSIYDGIPPRDINPEAKPGFCGIRYAATDERVGIKDRVSIHMPRWASRLTLTVTEVRVQRLQDISEEDAIAEGITCENVIVGMACYGGPPVEVTADRYFFDGCDDEGFEDGVSAYAALWDSINGSGAWAANPWVTATTFALARRNIDAEG